MGNYSPVECHMITPFDTIEGQYFSDGEFILSITFIVLVYLKEY